MVEKIGDVIGAVIVDTGTAAQEWGRIQQQKRTKRINKAPEPVVEEEKPPEPNQKRLSINKVPTTKERRVKTSARTASVSKK